MIERGLSRCLVIAMNRDLALLIWVWLACWGACNAASSAEITESDVRVAMSSWSALSNEATMSNSQTSSRGCLKADAKLQRYISIRQVAASRQR